MTWRLSSGGAGLTYVIPRRSDNAYICCTHPLCGGPMRHIAFLSLVIAAAWAAPAEAPAQPANRHSLGRQVAMELCSSCHRVAQGQLRPSRDVASFFAIANLPSTTALSLKVFLRTNHKGMPNLIVSEPDADALIDYILSLKRR
jgi:mono/diheme cytochrome c family protein